MKTGEFSELRSTRLVLRHLQPSDAARLCAYRSLAEVAQFQSWESFGPEDAGRLVEAQTGLAFATPDSWFQLAIVEAASETMIGDCGIHFLADDPRQVEIGVSLDPAFQKRGYATEALHRILDFLFRDLRLHRVLAVTDAGNRAAVRLFERLGFRKEAHFVENVWFKGAYGSEYLFALLSHEWLEPGS